MSRPDDQSTTTMAIGVSISVACLTLALFVLVGAESAIKIIKGFGLIVVGFVLIIIGISGLSDDNNDQ